MKRGIICFLTLIWFASSAQVSNSGKVSGKVTDGNNEAVTGAVAELRNAADSSLAKANVADVQGKFTMENVKPGNYFLKVSMLGYNPHTSTFALESGQAKELPEIKLTTSSVALKEAEVSAIKPLVEVKPDKVIFNVENSINSTGSTAFELLQKAPGVVVDNNDNVMLKGRGGVTVQIDGRPTRFTQSDLADYLKGIQSTDVEAIELISNPSSKYDAEGTAGIINIKLKKNKNFGTNGSVTAGYALGKYAKYNTALSLGTRTRKFNVYGSYSNNWGSRNNELYLYREQNPYIFNQSSVQKRSGLVNNYKAGVDYTVNKKHALGLMINGNYADIDGVFTNRNSIMNFNTLSTDSILKSDQTARGIRNAFDLNLNHHFVDSLGHELTTDFDYGYYNWIRDNYIPNVYTLPDAETPLSSSYFRSYTHAIINIFTLKSDYSANFLKGKLGVGYKTSFVRTDNIFDFYNILSSAQIIDTTRSNHFVYDENVNALYFNYQYTIKKFDFQAGVRMENTQSEGDLTSTINADDKNVKRNYTDFFPSGGITFNANKNNALGLTYSSRIDRPNYQELNPFEYKLDELSYMKGNPFLNPQYSNKIELSHTYKYATTTSISYSVTRDFFAQLEDTIAGGKNILAPRNLATEKILSLDFSTSLQPTPWYSIYLNTSLYNAAYDADFGSGKTISTSFMLFNMNGQNTFKLPGSVTFEVSGWYGTGGIWAGSYKTAAQGSLDLGLQKKFFRDQAILKLSYTDILFTAPWNAYNTYAGIVSRSTGNWESRQFRASLTWRFGNKQMKGIRQRTTGSESEQKRLGGNE
jgi:iron complex outermembrane receptor protein